jgi:hypothetical protein
MKYALIALLALTVLAAGCSPTGPDSSLSDPFIGGAQGLKVSFMQGAPPSEIFDGGQYPFSVNILVENLGEADVGPDSVTGATGDNQFALVSLIGFNPAQFNYPETDKTFAQEQISVLGARRNFDGTIIAGDTNIVQFEGYNYLPDEQGNSEIRIRANICYDYTTRTSTRVCIKDNILENIQDNSICVLTGPKDVKNSGSPVHVTKVAQNPLGRDKIQVTFTIENVGTGRVFRKVGSAWSSGPLGGGACDTSLTNPDRNYVFVDVFLGDESSTGLIQCPLLGNSNQGYINLFQGNAVTMSCTIQTNPQGNRVYTDTLRINLEYAYLDYSEVPILIRDVTVGPPTR